MTVHPGAGTKNDTLVHFLLNQIKQLSNLNIFYNQSNQEIQERPGIVHRLDRDTEGIMVIAKNNATHLHLGNQFKERQIYKEYHAWLIVKEAMQMKQNIFDIKQDVLEGYIQRSRRNRKIMEFTENPVNKKSRLSRLKYEVLKQQDNFYFVKIILQTGRTHQIRCSFAYKGCYVLGDEIYSSRSLKKAEISE